MPRTLPRACILPRQAWVEREDDRDLGAAGSSFGVVTRSASHGALDWLSSRGGGLGTGDLVLAVEGAAPRSAELSNHTRRELSTRPFLHCS